VTEKIHKKCKKPNDSESTPTLRRTAKRYKLPKCNHLKIKYNAREAGKKGQKPPKTAATKERPPKNGSKTTHRKLIK